MSEVAERHYLDDRALPPDRIAGLAVTRNGYARPTRVVRMVEAGHPVPDAAGLDATRDTLALADSAGPGDLVLALVSGGASANWIAPAAGMSLAEKQAVTRSLLRSGAGITEMNTLRKHLSRIKGGRLAARAHPGAGGDRRDLRRAGRRSGGDRVRSDRARSRPRWRTPAPSSSATGLPCPTASRAHWPIRRMNPPSPAIRSSPRPRMRLLRGHPRCFTPSRRPCARPDYDPIVLGTALEGEAREVAAAHARLARELRAAGRRAVILSGGELTVTLRGQGRGGPNQEYALALAIALDGTGRRGGACRRHRRYRRGRGASRGPGGRLRRATPRSPGRAKLASIRPSFLPTTIRPNSLRSLGTCWRPGRLTPTSMISGLSSLTAREVHAISGAGGARPVVGEMTP